VIQFTGKDFSFAKTLCSIFDNCHGPCLFSPGLEDWCDGCAFFEFSEKVKYSLFYDILIFCVGSWKMQVGKKPERKTFVRNLIYLTGLLYSANDKQVPLVPNKTFNAMTRMSRINQTSCAPKHIKRYIPQLFTGSSAFAAHARKSE